MHCRARRGRTRRRGRGPGRHALVGADPGSAAAGRNASGGGPPVRTVHRGGLRGGLRGCRLRDRLFDGARDRARPRLAWRAGRPAGLRAHPRARTGGRERVDVPAAVGADGAHLAAAGAGRAPAAPLGPGGRGLVCGDDPFRSGAAAGGAGALRGEGRRRDLRGAAVRGRRDVTGRAGHRIRAHRDRLRVQGGHGATARPAAARASRGAQPCLGPDERRDGESGGLRHRPDRLRPAGRRPALVVAAGARGGGALGGVRDPAGRDGVRPQTPAGVLDQREHGAGADRPGRGRHVRRRWRPRPGGARADRRAAARRQPLGIQGAVVLRGGFGAARHRAARPGRDGRPAGPDAVDGRTPDRRRPSPAPKGRTPSWRWRATACTRSRSARSTRG